jgi:hypothetical protein
MLDSPHTLAPMLMRGNISSLVAWELFQNFVSKRNFTSSLQRVIPSSPAVALVNSHINHLTLCSSLLCHCCPRCQCLTQADDCRSEKGQRKMLPLRESAHFTRHKIVQGRATPIGSECVVKGKPTSWLCWTFCSPDDDVSGEGSSRASFNRSTHDHVVHEPDSNACCSPSGVASVLRAQHSKGCVRGPWRQTRKRSASRSTRRPRCSKCAGGSRSWTQRRAATRHFTQNDG